MPTLHATVFGLVDVCLQNDAESAATNDAVELTLPPGVTSVRLTLSVPFVSVEPALFWMVTW